MIAFQNNTLEGDKHINIEMKSKKKNESNNNHKTSRY